MCGNKVIEWFLGFLGLLCVFLQKRKLFLAEQFLLCSLLLCFFTFFFWVCIFFEALCSLVCDEHRYQNIFKMIIVFWISSMTRVVSSIFSENLARRNLYVVLLMFLQNLSYSCGHNQRHAPLHISSLRGQNYSNENKKHKTNYTNNERTKNKRTSRISTETFHEKFLW